MIMQIHAQSTALKTILMSLSVRILYSAIILAGGITGLLKWSYLTRPFKLLSGLLLVTFVSETAAYISAIIIRSNVLVFNIFDPVEVIFFTFIFSYIFISLRYRRMIILSGIIITFLIILTSVLKLQGNLINTIAIVIKSNFYIILSLLKFKEILLNPEEDNLLKEPVFWVCSSVLFFFSINLLYWASSNYLEKYDHRYNLAWLLNYSNIIFYLLILYSFLLIKKNKKEYFYSDG